MIEPKMYQIKGVSLVTTKNAFVLYPLNAFTAWSERARKRSERARERGSEKCSVQPSGPLKTGSSVTKNAPNESNKNNGLLSFVSLIFGPLNCRG